MLYTVTGRVHGYKQPRGGFVRPRAMTEIDTPSICVLHDQSEESVHASLIGLAVDYLTRFVEGASPEEAFEYSLKGARVLQGEGVGYIEGAENAVEQSKQLLAGITGLDDRSIVNACKIVGYDGCYRTGIDVYRPVEDIEPNEATIFNVRTMVERSRLFFQEYGPIVLSGFRVFGNGAKHILLGDGDYATKDTLWDFKVSKKLPTSQHTLQLLVYYRMGLRSDDAKVFEGMRRLGVFNPRLAKAWLVDIDSISKETIELVDCDVIGY